MGRLQLTCGSMSKAWHSRFTRAKAWSKAQVKLKILISLVQVLNGMGFAFSINYPVTLSGTLSAVAGIFEIDLPTLMPLECIVPMNYFGKLVLRTILPLVAYALMLAGARLFYKLKMPWQADALVDGVFFLMFLVYPSTVRAPRARWDTLHAAQRRVHSSAT